MGKIENEVKEILTRFRQTAKRVAKIYSLQHKEDLDTFLKTTVYDVIPKSMRKFMFVSDIISDIVRADVMGVELSEDKKQSHVLLIKEHLDELLEVVEEEDNFLLPPDLEKFRKYGLPILLKTAQFRTDARILVKEWKAEGGDLDEFLKENTRCQCGKCDPFNRAGDLYSEILISMVHVTLENRKATDGEVEGWLIKMTEAYNFTKKNELLKNINLN